MYNSYKFALLVSVTHIAAYDPGKPGWKMTADGKALELGADGNPIYIDANGAEMVVESNTISRLNAEAKKHREDKEAAQRDLAKFKDIIDPEAAKKALDTVSKLDQKKLIDAGEVDKVRKEISDTFNTQLTERDQKVNDLQSRLDNMTKSTAFRSSKFVQERVALPIDVFEDSFGKFIKVENGKLVPYGRDGNVINSAKRLGEVADLDEALEKLIETHPHKDKILAAPNAQGSGNNGGGGARGGGRFVKRADFEKLSPTDAKITADKAASGEITLVD